MLRGMVAVLEFPFLFAVLLQIANLTPPLSAIRPPLEGSRRIEPVAKSPVLMDRDVIFQESEVGIDIVEKEAGNYLKDWCQVTHVYPDSQAWSLGVKSGMFVTAIAGMKVADCRCADVVRKWLALMQAGNNYTVTFNDNATFHQNMVQANTGLIIISFRAWGRLPIEAVVLRVIWGTFCLVLLAFLPSRMYYMWQDSDKCPPWRFDDSWMPNWREDNEAKNKHFESTAALLQRQEHLNPKLELKLPAPLTLETSGVKCDKSGYVVEVQENEVADKEGVKKGMWILKVEEHTTKSDEQATEAFSELEHTTKSDVTVTFVDSSIQELTFKFKPGEPAGFTVGTMDDVVHIDPGKQAAKMGVTPGLHIWKVEDTSLTEKHQALQRASVAETEYSITFVSERLPNVHANFLTRKMSSNVVRYLLFFFTFLEAVMVCRWIYLVHLRAGRGCGALYADEGASYVWHLASGATLTCTAIAFGGVRRSKLLKEGTVLRPGATARIRRYTRHAFWAFLLVFGILGAFWCKCAHDVIEGRGDVKDWIEAIAIPASCGGLFVIALEIVLALTVALAVSQEHIESITFVLLGQVATFSEEEVGGYEAALQETNAIERSSTGEDYSGENQGAMSDTMTGTLTRGNSGNIRTLTSGENNEEQWNFEVERPCIRLVRSIMPSLSRTASSCAGVSASLILALVAHLFEIAASVRPLEEFVFFEFALGGLAVWILLIPVGATTYCDEMVRALHTCRCELSDKDKAQEQVNKDNVRRVELLLKEDNLGQGVSLLLYGVAVNRRLITSVLLRLATSVGVLYGAAQFFLDNRQLEENKARLRETSPPTIEILQALNASLINLTREIRQQ